MFAISSTTAVAARVACARRVGAKKFNPLAAHVARGAGLLAASRRSRSHVPRGAMSLAEQEGVARGALHGACFLGYYPRPL